MFKSSKVNPPAPLLEEGHPRGKGMPPQPTQAAGRSGAKSGDSPAVVEARPSKASSTFRAPRSDSEGGPMEKGYTKVGM